MPSRTLNLISIVLVALLLAPPTTSHACSAVAKTTSSSFLVGASYDWIPNGGIVFKSPVGQLKTAFTFSQQSRPISWTSKYGSLTISQFGRDFPMQGINEAGLVGMVLLAPAQYPSASDRGTISESQWLQYQLDQYSTVREIESHLKDFSIERVSANLHWFFCDASSACAVVEFNSGRAQIYRGENLSVTALTNHSYQQSLIFWYLAKASEHTKPSGYQSERRFIRLADFLSGGDNQSVDSALDDVASVKFTAWQTIFAPHQKTLKVRLPGSDWKAFDLKNMDFKCQKNLKVFDLGSASWMPFERNYVEQMFEQSASGAEGLNRDRRQVILDRTSAVSCSDGAL